MILKAVVLLIICQSIFCHPQSIRLPDIKNKAQPAEVNSLDQHNHHPRSIAASPDVYSQNNVEETIKEVEAMLKANPTLPRLTRGEILDLLENITETDKAKNKLVSKNEEVKERDPKAIMVVMPYTPSNGNDKNMEELFTKPPVTHIVGAEPFKKTQESYNFKRIPQEISNIPELDNNKKYAVEKDKTPSDITTKSNLSTSTPPSTTFSAIKEISAPPQYTPKKTNYRRKRPPLSATPSPTTYHPTRRPIRRRPSTTARYSNHRYPDDVSTESVKTSTALPSNGIRIIDAPQFISSDISEDLQMEENRHKGVLMENGSYKVSEENGESGDVNLKKDSNSGSILMDLVPDNLKGVLKDIETKVGKPPKLRTTSTTRTPSEKEENEEIRKMLASFGVLPIKTTTTTTPVPDISHVADNLTPEMRDLLKSFGLISDSNEKKPSSVSSTTEEIVGYNPVKAEVKPDAYLGFKPLPEDDYSRHDMEELLARFGLGRNSRKEKSITKKREDNEEKEEKIEGLNFDVVPEQYQEVLEDIGLTDRQGKMIRAEPLSKTQEKQHVFNPAEPQYASDEELEKLNKLIGVVKQLESLNGSVTDEDLKKIDMVSLKELISSLNEENKIIPLDEQRAPNPVNFDYGLEKNEIKRQENATNTTASSSTTTEEPQTANLKDLEASFGGQVDTTPVTEAPTAETTTQARRTGFYYLVDWNTFLDIDDQKGKRVNLRFQPTVGDPKRFYSVSVP